MKKKLIFALCFICLLITFVLLYEKYAPKSTDIIISPSAESNSFNNFSSGGEMAFSNGELYYFDNSFLIGGLRKISNGKNLYVGEKFEKMYAYENLLYCLKNGNLYTYNSVNKNVLLLLNNVDDFAIASQKLYFIRSDRNGATQGLFRIDLDAKNEQRIADDPLRIIVAEDKVYYFSNKKLNEENQGKWYYHLCAENQNGAKVGMTDFFGEPENISVSENTILMDYATYNLGNDSYQQIIEPREYKEENNYQKLNSTGFDKNFYYANYNASKKFAFIVPGEHNNESYVGIWKINSQTNSKLKLSDEYGIEGLYVFDHKYLFYLANNSVHQIMQ